MRTLLLAAVAVAALGSASAYAGEGNGPTFPGLQAVSTGVTTLFVDDNAGTIVSTSLLSSSNGLFQSMNSLPAHSAVPSRPQRMIATLSGFDAG